MEKNTFPLAEAFSLVKDLIKPNPVIYWIDFLFSITVGWGAFVVTLKLPNFSLGQGVAYLVSALALYRSLIFIHEIAHFPRNSFKLFRAVWNLSCGFPLCIPAFGYLGVHLDHHKKNKYGTQEDGEYLPFAAQAPWHIVSYLFLIFVLPLVFSGRSLILTPLTLFHRGIRRWVWEHISSLAIDMNYSRPPAPPKDATGFRVQELMTFVYTAVFVGLLVVGVLPIEAAILWYLIGVMGFLLNSLRTLAAHCYRNPGNQTMSFEDQYLDSVDIPGNFLTGLWAPVGLRYHATHHLFPAMPYHNLGKARRRLETQLSDNSLYQKALRSGLWSSIGILWNEAKASQGLSQPTLSQPTPGKTVQEPH